MNQYVTGAMIKRLREEHKMTQNELAEKLSVSDKTISKWETSKGYPDISLIEPLAKALGISVIELLSGSDITNTNRSFNMLRSEFYVCPVCGNVITSTGEAIISCHGITLPPLEAEILDFEHEINIEISDGEYYITAEHEMSRQHYISFIAAVSDNEIQTVKLYPEGSCEARFRMNRVKYICMYCNRHGFFKKKI